MSVAARVYPEVGDLVVATVEKIVDYGAYASLDEYDGLEGLVHRTELATSWVKHIRDHVREGQKLVLLVLRVSPGKSQVDLSLRRVTGREKTEKMLEWKKAKKAESIIKGAAERLKADEQAVENIRKIIYEKFDNPYECFEEAIEEGEEKFSKLGLDADWSRTLTEVARGKIKVERARVRGTIELTCSKSDGVEAIRNSLLAAKKLRRRGSSVSIYTLGSPKYRVEVAARDYPQAESVLNQAIEEALNAIKSYGGEGRKVS